MAPTSVARRCFGFSRLHKRVGFGEPSLGIRNEHARTLLVPSNRGTWCLKVGI